MANDQGSFDYWTVCGKRAIHHQADIGVTDE